MSIRSSAFVAAVMMVSGCVDGRAISSSAATGSGSGDGGTPGTGSSSGLTGSGGSDVAPGDSTGTPSTDLPLDASLCPEGAMVALCIPASADAGAFCLCSRQALGSGVAVAGDLDGDGLDDVLVQSEQGDVTALRSDGASLQEVEPVVFPVGVSASETALQYVPSLGVVAYASLGSGDLDFGIYALGEPPTAAATLSIGTDEDILTSWWFGDFDGDGALDLAVTRAAFIDLGTVLVELIVYLDATTPSAGIELFSAPLPAAIDGPQVQWHVDDADSDGFDDLWFQPFQPGFPQMSWGGIDGPALAGTAMPVSPVHHAFDLTNDGARDLLGYGWSFGGFVVIEQTRARSFAPAVVVPADRSIEIVGNDVQPLSLGERRLALALAGDGALAMPPGPTRSAIGVTAIDALPDVAPMRTALIEDVAVVRFGTLDIDGDGRDEIVGTIRDAAGSAHIHLFDVVESLR